MTPPAAGCWLTLLPLTDPPIIKQTTNYQTTNQQTTNQQTTNQQQQAITNQQQQQKLIHFNLKIKKNNSINNEFLLLQPSSSSKRNKSFPPPPILPLQESSLLTNNKKLYLRDSFETRPLQVCDIDRVKELHSSTLPVSYPCSFFYNLLMSNTNDIIISLVATLPSTGIHSHMDSPHSYQNQRHHNHHHHLNNHHLNHHTHHHNHHNHFHHQRQQYHPSLPTSSTSPLNSNHHLHHHITSPLSGRKPISLDIVGCITAQIHLSPPHPSSSHVDKSSLSIRILTLCVGHDYRRLGIGKMLLEDLIQKIKLDFSKNYYFEPNLNLFKKNNIKINNNNNNKIQIEKIKIDLHVQAINSVALKFYLDFGFKIAEFKPSYYLNNELKPIDSSLKSHQPLDKNQHSNYPTEKKDIDAWLLELNITS